MAQVCCSFFLWSFLHGTAFHLICLLRIHTFQDVSIYFDYNLLKQNACSQLNVPSQNAIVIASSIKLFYETTNQGLERILPKLGALILEFCTNKSTEQEHHVIWQLTVRVVPKRVRALTIPRPNWTSTVVTDRTIKTEPLETSECSKHELMRKPVDLVYQPAGWTVASWYHQDTTFVCVQFFELVGGRTKIVRQAKWNIENGPSRWGAQRTESAQHEEIVRHRLFVVVPERDIVMD